MPRELSPAVRPPGPRAAARGLVAVAVAALALGCASASEPVPGARPPEPPPPPPPPLIDMPRGPEALPAPAEPDVAAPASACPADMAFVDTTYCPEVELSCVKDEYNKSNRITICHEFAPGQRCLGAPRRQRFCIDRYEYPNEAGAHPPVMVSWHDAAGACAARGKRLCWESEWVSACEGPEKLPFPYGQRRDATKCNIDNRWLEPGLSKIYSRDPAVQGAELLRLDQSVKSGEMSGCVSGFGVHDLTGNLDEWVNAEQEYKVSKWAGLKGGAWGHVRNACRPMTTSHAPEWSYYFVSFRCCADAEPDEEAERDPTLWRAPRQPAAAGKPGNPSPGFSPKERGPNQPKPR